MKKIFILILISFYLVSCSSKPIRKSTTSTSAPESKQETVKQEKISVDSESFGPPAPPPAAIAAGVAAAKEAERLRAENASEDYTLLLGPGLARTLSFVGVLKELDQNEKKFRAIVGVEMGALMAAIYSQANSNKLEWETYKFGIEQFIDSSFLGMSKKGNQGKSFEQFLQKIFGNADANQTKKHIYIALANSDPNLTTDKIKFYDRGLLKDLVRAAVSFPGIIKNTGFDGASKLSAAFEDPYPIEKIKDITGGKLLCVDAIGKGNDFFPQNQNEELLSNIYRSLASMAQKGLNECDETIRVDVSGISPMQFDARAELIVRGKAAAQKWLSK